MSGESFMEKRKKISAASDLALNGAKPSFSELIHVGRPNMGDRDVFIKHVNDIFDRRWLSNNGPLVEQLEKRIAEVLGVKHCVAMCNGTVALEIAIRAVQLTGEVIVPSYTFIATAHALSWQGITPVFADIDPATHTLDPDAVRRMITPRTTGILATHVWGAQVLPSLAFGLLAAATAGVAMAASGLQSQILLLLVGIGASATTSLVILGLALLFGHDLTGLLSRSRTKSVID
jgi:hypothetical protein